MGERESRSVCEALADEFEPYFRSGNTVAVSEASIPADLGWRIVRALRSETARTPGDIVRSGDILRTDTVAALPSAEVPSSKLLQDIKYELQRVMMGARWERASFDRLLERINWALSEQSATGTFEEFETLLLTRR